MKHKKHHKMHNGRAGMLHEDKSAPSSCPREVMMTEYPAVDYLYQPIDDTMYGIDHQMDTSVKDVRRHMAKKKY